MVETSVKTAGSHDAAVIDTSSTGTDLVLHSGSTGEPNKVATRQSPSLTPNDLRGPVTRRNSRPAPLRWAKSTWAVATHATLGPDLDDWNNCGVFLLHMLHELYTVTPSRGLGEMVTSVMVYKVKNDPRAIAAVAWGIVAIDIIRVIAFATAQVRRRRTTSSLEVAKAYSGKQNPNKFEKLGFHATNVLTAIELTAIPVALAVLVEAMRKGYHVPGVDFSDTADWAGLLMRDEIYSPGRDILNPTFSNVSIQDLGLTEAETETLAITLGADPSAVGSTGFGAGDIEMAPHSNGGIEGGSDMGILARPVRSLNAGNVTMLQSLEEGTRWGISQYFIACVLLDKVTDWVGVSPHDESFHVGLHVLRALARAFVIGVGEGPNSYGNAQMDVRNRRAERKLKRETERARLMDAGQDTAHLDTAAWDPDEIRQVKDVRWGKPGWRRLTQIDASRVGNYHTDRTIGAISAYSVAVGPHGENATKSLFARNAPVAFVIGKIFYELQIGQWQVFGKQDADKANGGRLLTPEVTVENGGGFDGRPSTSGRTDGTLRHSRVGATLEPFTGAGQRHGRRLSVAISRPSDVGDWSRPRNSEAGSMRETTLPVGRAVAELMQRMRGITAIATPISEARTNLMREAGHLQSVRRKHDAVVKDHQAFEGALKRLQDAENGESAIGDQLSTLKRFEGLLDGRGSGLVADAGVLEKAMSIEGLADAVSRENKSAQASSTDLGATFSDSRRLIAGQRKMLTERARDAAFKTASIKPEVDDLAQGQSAEARLSSLKDAVESAKAELQKAEEKEGEAKAGWSKAVANAPEGLKQLAQLGLEITGPRRSAIETRETLASSFRADLMARIGDVDRELANGIDAEDVTMTSELEATVAPYKKLKQEISVAMAALVPQAQSWPEKRLAIGRLQAGDLAKLAGSLAGHRQLEGGAALRAADEEVKALADMTEQAAGLQKQLSPEEPTS
ncbi:MAG: hypothetical protein ABW032_09835 [Burkholderiaceae bacterium]